MVEAEVEVRGKFKEAMILTLKLEEAAMSQEMREASRSWKRKGMHSLLESLERTTSADTLALAQ